jgi:hypothetical protein
MSIKIEVTADLRQGDIGCLAHASKNGICVGMRTVKLSRSPHHDVEEDRADTYLHREGTHVGVDGHKKVVTVLSCDLEIIDGSLVTFVKKGSLVIDILELLVEEEGLRFVVELHIVHEPGELLISEQRVVLGGGAKRRCQHSFFCLLDF